MQNITDAILEYVDFFCKAFYNGAKWDITTMSTLLFRIFMFASCGLLTYSALSYLKKYKIFSALFTKITGNAKAYDRIRRAQMRAELENKSACFTRQKKESLITKMYALISKTGVIEKIPGFSEAGFIVCVIAVDLCLFAWMTFSKGLVTGAVSATAFVIVVCYCLSLAAYNRKVKLERQLLQFTNACASASLQYSNIIDIFGTIYDQFSSPLKEGLEACYVEAKQTNNKELALRHLKEKYDSVQFSFVVDNMELCSLKTGNYYSVARDIAEPISIFNTSYEKKRVLLRNAKINITVMFCVAVGILAALSVFLENLKDTLFNTTFGNISIIAIILLYFYGLNIKTEK